MANIFSQNPMRIDTVMTNDYLTTIGVTPRPIKIVSIRIENPTAAGIITITDGAATPNTIYEVDLTPVATVGGTYVDNTQRLWKNFKVTVLQAGAVIWIERR